MISFLRVIVLSVEERERERETAFRQTVLYQMKGFRRRLNCISGRATLYEPRVDVKNSSGNQAATYFSVKKKNTHTNKPAVVRLCFCFDISRNVDVSKLIMINND